MNEGILDIESLKGKLNSRKEMLTCCIVACSNIATDIYFGNPVCKDHKEYMPSKFVKEAENYIKNE